MEIISARIIGLHRECIIWVNDALDIRTVQALEEFVSIASSPLVRKQVQDNTEAKWIIQEMGSPGLGKPF